MQSRVRLQLESMEDRVNPATFGIPWADSNLALSFVPDGTSITGTSSNLFSRLNENSTPQQWQKIILDAYYQWTRYTNLNVSVQPDSGDPSGASGRFQGDSRFGDIRIGGKTLSPDVLAISSPPDPSLSGTFAGDMILNTYYPFDGSPYRLDSVVLHEAGHTLGLDHSMDPSSPLYPIYQNQMPSLTAGDISRIQQLYGVRGPDGYEGMMGNDTFWTARSLRDAINGMDRAPLLTFADISSATDVDVYSFVTPDNMLMPGPNLSIRLQSTGISLLSATVQIYYLDQMGNPVEAANMVIGAEQFQGGAATISFNPNDQMGPRTYYLRVSATDGASYNTGRYAIGVTFDGTSLENQDLRLLLPPAGPINVSNPPGMNNDTLLTATPLSPASQSFALGRAELNATLSDMMDIDYYQVTAGLTNPIITASVRTQPGGAISPHVAILDANGNLVMPATVLRADVYAYTVQAAGLIPGATYYLRVTLPMLFSPATGDYNLTVDFGEIATEFNNYAEGELVNGDSEDYTLYVGEGQMFHYVLSTTGMGGAADGVRMTITNLTGNILYDLTSFGGQTINGNSLFLDPGKYRVTFTQIGMGAPISYSVSGARTTDPIDAIIIDTTFQPNYRDPNDPSRFRYPGNSNSTLSTFMWILGWF